MANTVILSIEDMVCGHCALTVEEAPAKVNLRKKEARVSIGPGVSVEELIQAVEATGYRASAKSR